jgi:GH24 family phage-related lysozyme (muramidase)
MDINKLRKEIENDEGKVLKIYKDHLGYPTFGIGHLITLQDPEKGLPIGTPVSESRISNAFNSDILTVLNSCKKLYPDFDELPEEAQLIIANMMFNLGFTRLSKFRNMKKAINSRNWTKAAAEMVDSKWYKQVTKRAKRLVERMKKVSDEKKLNIIEMPLINQMVLLECDNCRQTALNLYMNKEFTCLAYRCITCNHAGYFHVDGGEDI